MTFLLSPLGPLLPYATRSPGTNDIARYGCNTSEIFSSQETAEVVRDTGGSLVNPPVRCKDPSRGRCIIGKEHMAAQTASAEGF